MSVITTKPPPGLAVKTHESGFRGRVRVSGFGFGCCAHAPGQGLGFKVQGLGFRVPQLLYPGIRACFAEEGFTQRKNTRPLLPAITI